MISHAPSIPPLEPSSAQNSEDVLAVADRTVPAALRRAALRVPDQAALIEPRGRTIVYRELEDEAKRAATALRALGLAPGDTVLAMLDEHADHVIAWLGANIASVPWVPINTSFKGSMLQYMVEHSRARVLIIEGKWVDRITEIATDLTHLETIIVRNGGDATAPSRFVCHDLALLQQDEIVAMDEPKVSDISSIVYTSGTQGRPKGVLVPHGHAYATSMPRCYTDPTDSVVTEIVMVAMPFFHAGGLFTGPLQAIRTGGTAVLHGAFSATRYWDDVRRHHCTTALLAGPMAVFLLRQPPTPDDRNHDLKSVIMMPAIPEIEEFSSRFGVPVGIGYGCTEIGAPLFSKPGESRPGGCGSPLPGYEVQLVDESDVPVPAGEVGEMVVRSCDPWSISSGYLDDPDATLGAWTNLWFHTGDMHRLDESGQYVFVDRRKDVLRRRGENISSFEVERHLLELPEVIDAAVVAVPSDVAEDDVKAVIVLGVDATFNPHEMLRQMYLRMPYFMVPRYIEVVDALPRTQTQKVQKAILRAQGLSDRVWDCEAAGFRITRHELIGPE